VVSALVTTETGLVVDVVEIVETVVLELLDVVEL
jgi:hypothetical protein